MSVFRIALAVLRNDSRSRIGTALVTVGVALGVSLVLWLASAPNALQHRAERTAWRSTDNAVSQQDTRALMAMATNSDQYDGKLIHRFDVALTKAGNTPTLAPGISKVPGPGEVLLSPVLADLVKATPPQLLGDRFPGQVVGEIGDQALEYPDELVAIIGHQPGTIDGRFLAGFGGNDAVAQDNGDMLYLLTRVGMVVLIVPCLVLVASAARLTATRRERRLAALRLAGATPVQVIAMTAVETVIGAVLGSVLAVAVAQPLSHLTAMIPWGGGTWLPGDFTSGPLFVGFVAVLAPVLVVGAAVLGLRRVVDRPLMAAAEQSRRKISPARLLGLVAAGGVFLLGLSIATGGRSDLDRFTVVLVGLGAVAVALVLAGPVVTALVGRYFVGRWRKPSTLLAGRRLLGDPVASFRAAAGVVVAVFAGSMALTMLPGLEREMPTFSGPWKDNAIVAQTVGQSTVGPHTDAIAELRAELARRNLNAPVIPLVGGSLTSTSDENRPSYEAVIAPCKDIAMVLSGLSTSDCTDGPAVYLPRGSSDALHSMEFRLNPSTPTDTPSARPLPADVPLHKLSDWTDMIVIDPAVFPDLAAKPTGAATVTTPSTKDAVYTAVVRVLPDVAVSDNYRDIGHMDTLMADLRRATAIGLGLMALLSGASAAVAAAGSVIDRRRTFGALIAAGTPVRVLARALRREVVLPVLVATIGSSLAGMLVGLGLLDITHSISGHGESLLSPWILAPGVAGFAVALAAAAACGPVLRTFSARDYSAE
ncbi:FtsX-like permease family protein [Kutzneria buriramensis]|uniref:FtsX-like permease family protein n=1 Tax=Kutzneria buriramensis TaxID=1045776 RepID=A0A3E0I5R3_9PSEU|nr:FtsX-like permease family protein [Kutzneria buriramensis]REH54088.1 FtsX-like permease family protein [Kutzneria buriramensis]